MVPTAFCQEQGEGYVLEVVEVQLMALLGITGISGFDTVIVAGPAVAVSFRLNGSDPLLRTRHCGKENTMVENKIEGQESQVPPTSESGEGQVQGQSPEGQTETPQEFLARTGFKSLADAEKSFKEAQRKISQQGEQISKLDKALQGTYAQSTQPRYTPPQGQGADFFDDPEGHVVRLARQIAAEEVTGKVQELEAKQSITRVRSENPAKFDALRPIVQQIYMEKPYLNTLGEDGLRQAMEEASSRRQQYLSDLKAEMFPDQTNGNQQDIKSQVRNEVLAEQERARGATIPQGGAARPISSDADKKRQELVQSGDVDALLDIKLKGF